MLVPILKVAPPPPKLRLRLFAPDTLVQLLNLAISLKQFREEDSIPLADEDASAVGEYTDNIPEDLRKVERQSDWKGGKAKLIVKHLKGSIFRTFISRTESNRDLH